MASIFLPVISILPVCSIFNTEPDEMSEKLSFNVASKIVSGLEKRAKQLFIVSKSQCTVVRNIKLSFWYQPRWKCGLEKVGEPCVTGKLKIPKLRRRFAGSSFRWRNYHGFTLAIFCSLLDYRWQNEWKVKAFSLNSTFKLSCHSKARVPV